MTTTSRAAPARISARRRRRWWGVASVVGELALTAGVVLLLFCVYQLWWTNVQSAAATAAVQQDLVQEWRTHPAVVTHPQVEPEPATGEAFALMYIPRLRDKVWGLPVVEGVKTAQLAEGAGHYPGSAMPGEVGNFAVAAHRATHDEPFRDIDQLRVGDKVYVQTQTAWYTYILDKDKIVDPDAIWVVDPVPGKPGAVPTQELITLTTCNPRWASYERWIWWGHLVATTPADQGPPDRLTGTKG